MPGTRCCLMRGHQLIHLPFSGKPNNMSVPESRCHALIDPELSQVIYQLACERIVICRIQNLAVAIGEFDHPLPLQYDNGTVEKNALLAVIEIRVLICRCNYCVKRFTDVCKSLCYIHIADKGYTWNCIEP